MNNDDPDFILVPRHMLMPQQLAEAEGYAKYMAARKADRLDRALRDGSASKVEKIRAAWAKGGGRMVFGPNGFAYLEAGFCAPALLKDPGPEVVVHSDRLLFEREVTRNHEFTVTRIHCQGLTVEETVEMEDDQ